MITWPGNNISAAFERSSHSTYLHCEIVLNLVQCTSRRKSGDSIRWELLLATLQNAIAVPQLACGKYQAEVGEVTGFWHSYTDRLIVLRKNLCFA